VGLAARGQRQSLVSSRACPVRSPHARERAMAKSCCRQLTHTPLSSSQTSSSTVWCAVLATRKNLHRQWLAAHPEIRRRSLWRAARIDKTGSLRRPLHVHPYDVQGLSCPKSRLPLDDAAGLSACAGVARGNLTKKSPPTQESLREGKHVGPFVCRHDVRAQLAGRMSVLAPGSLCGWADRKHERACSFIISAM